MFQVGRGGLRAELLYRENPSGSARLLYKIILVAEVISIVQFSFILGDALSLRDKNAGNRISIDSFLGIVKL